MTKISPWPVDQETIIFQVGLAPIYPHLTKY